MSYVTHGQLIHWRSFLLTDIIALQKESESGCASFWEKAMLQPDLSYWSVNGLLKTKQKEAYPLLVGLLDDTSVSLATKANIIKKLSQHSKQTFDRHLPSDPGYWKGHDLRTDEVKGWSQAGFPEGEGYVEPLHHASLDNPQTKFEKLVARLNTKLEKKRNAQEMDLANPRNYLTPASEDDIKSIAGIWELPSIYLQFLRNYSPLNVTIKGISLYGAHNLIKKQAGYSYHAITKAKTIDWPDGYVVIADIGANPFSIDIKQGNASPVYQSNHGCGTWSFDEYARNFEDLIRKLS